MGTGFCHIWRWFCEVERKTDRAGNAGHGAGILQQQGYNAQRVAVERNGEIVRRADFEKELLRDEDTVEVVTFVGGG